MVGTRPANLYSEPKKQTPPSSLARKPSLAILKPSQLKKPPAALPLKIKPKSVKSPVARPVVQKSPTKKTTVKKTAASQPRPVLNKTPAAQTPAAEVPLEELIRRSRLKQGAVDLKATELFNALDDLENRLKKLKEELPEKTPDK